MMYCRSETTRISVSFTDDGPDGSHRVEDYNLKDVGTLPNIESPYPSVGMRGRFRSWAEKLTASNPFDLTLAILHSIFKVQNVSTHRPNRPVGPSVAREDVLPVGLVLKELLVYSVQIIGIRNVDKTNLGTGGRETVALPPATQGARDVSRAQTIQRIKIAPRRSRLRHFCRKRGVAGRS